MAKQPAFEIIGFKKLKDMLDPIKFNRRFVTHVGKATKKNAIIGQSDVVKRIYAGEFRKLSDLTITLKLKGEYPGGSRPLVGSGLLASSIHGEAVSWHEAHIGVLRNSPRKGGKSAFMIANVLHNGAVIPVTPKMRRLFWYWANKYGTKPLKASTKKIVLRKRPFLKTVLRKVNVEKYKRNWDRAVQRAMSGKNR